MIMIMMVMMMMMMMMMMAMFRLVCGTSWMWRSRTGFSERMFPKVTDHMKIPNTTYMPSKIHYHSNTPNTPFQIPNTLSQNNIINLP